MGRVLILIGVGLVILGALVWLLDRGGIHLGPLPGDIVIRGRNTTFYFPIMTCILVSVIFTLIMWLFNRRP